MLVTMRQRSGGEQQGNGRDHRLGQATAEQSVQQKAEERQQRDQPQMKRGSASS